MRSFGNNHSVRKLTCALAIASAGVVGLGGTAVAQTADGQPSMAPTDQVAPLPPVKQDPLGLDKSSDPTQRPGAVTSTLSGPLNLLTKIFGPWNDFNARIIRGYAALTTPTAPGPYIGSSGQATGMSSEGSLDWNKRAYK